MSTDLPRALLAALLCAAAGTATALFYAFTKVMDMMGPVFLQASAVIGALTFLGMNILALKQEKTQRLLGYSSISQIGLVILAYSLIALFGLDNGEFIVFGLLSTHALAKALLFWLAGLVDREKLSDRA